MPLLCVLLPFLLGGIQAQHRVLLSMGAAPSGTITTPCIVPSLTQTSTGTFDVTCSGFGTAKGVITLGTEVASGNTAHTTVTEAGVGFTDGTAQFFRLHNATGTSSRRRQYDAETIAGIFSGGSVDGEANFDSFITNGVRFNTGDAWGGQTRFHTILLGGSALSVKVGSVTASATNGGTVSVTGVGFLADIVIVSSSYSGTLNSTLTPAHFCYGVAVRSKGQGSIGYYADFSGTTKESSVSVEDRYACTHQDNINFLQAIEIGNFGSDGFDVTSRIGSVSGIAYHFMALSLGGVKSTFFKVVDMPTSTGNQSETGLGVTPEYVHLLYSSATATRTVTTGSTNASSAGISSFTSSTSGVIGWIARDDVTGTNGRTSFNTNVLDFDLPDASDAHIGTFVSFGSGQYTLNLTAVTSPAKKALVWGWGN